MASEGVGVRPSELSWPWINIPSSEFEGGVEGPAVDKVDVVELGEWGGGIAGGVTWGLVSEASNGSCDVNAKDMTVSVSKNVTRLRELEEAVDEDEEDGDEDGMRESNIKTVKQPVLSARIEPSEQQLELGKSRRNKIPHWH